MRVDGSANLTMPKIPAQYKCAARCIVSHFTPVPPPPEGARPLSGRVPPLSDLLHSSFTYINLCQPSETLYKSITAQTSSS